MTAVYVLRHPETTWNVDRRYQGRLEAPLSLEGEQQANMAARNFRGQNLAAVYSSPLSRSRHLAALIAEVTGNEVTIDNRLTEIGQCPWEALEVGEVRRRYPNLFAQWYSAPASVQFPSGESVHDVWRRSQSALADIFARHQDADVAVITHSVVVMALACAALSLDLRHLHSITASNAGITILCGQRAPGYLLELNNTSAIHAEPIPRAAAHNCSSDKDVKATQ